MFFSQSVGKMTLFIGANPSPKYRHHVVASCWQDKVVLCFPKRVRSSDRFISNMHTLIQIYAWLTHATVNKILFGSNELV